MGRQHRACILLPHAQSHPLPPRRPVSWGGEQTPVSLSHPHTSHRESSAGKGHHCGISDFSKLPLLSTPPICMLHVSLSQARCVPQRWEPVRGPLSHAFPQNIKHYLGTLKEASTTSSPPQCGFALAEAARPPPARGRHPHGLSLLFTPLCSWQKVLAGLGARST